jgi:hypothetical protein
MGTVVLRKFANLHYCDWIYEGCRRRNILTEIKQSVTYPTAVIVRDIFEATVSGYLYHKSGRECKDDAWGIPYTPPKQGWLLGRRKSAKWKNFVHATPYPPTVADYSLCEALRATNNQTGLAIYFEWARQVYYKNAVILKRDQASPTLFICLRDVLRDERAVVRRVDAYFGFTREATYRRYHASLRDDDKMIAIGGDHATSDNAMRLRLLRMLYDIDQHLFHGQTVEWNNALGCAIRSTATAKKSYKYL